MLHLFGPEPKSWTRWRSRADQCQRHLTEQQIAPGNPGAILKDVDTLLKFVGPGGIVTKSRNASLPSELLPELNSKVSHPIQLALKRALLRDYPNLAGIFVLSRVMDLLRMKGHRLVVCPEALEFWRGLNFAEQYFALLEALLFQAQSAVLGGGHTREDSQSIEATAVFLDQLSDRWRNFDRYESVRHLGPKGELPPWRLFVLQQFGIIEIRPADFSKRDRNFWGGQGWLVGGAKLTPWGAAVAWALLAFLKKREEEQEELGDEIRPSQRETRRKPSHRPSLGCFSQSSVPISRNGRLSMRDRAANLGWEHTFSRSDWRDGMGDGIPAAFGADLPCRRTPRWTNWRE